MVACHRSAPLNPFFQLLAMHIKKMIRLVVRISQTYVRSHPNILEWCMRDFNSVRRVLVIDVTAAAFWKRFGGNQLARYP